MEANYLGRKLLNGQLKIGFICSGGYWDLHYIVQRRKVWSTTLKKITLIMFRYIHHVHWLNTDNRQCRKSKVEGPQRKIRRVQTGLSFIQERHYLCLLLAGGEKEQDDWYGVKMDKSHFSHISENMGVFKQKILGFNCLGLPTGCCLQFFHFLWQCFHRSSLQLAIPHFCFLGGDKYQTTYRPDSCCPG